MSKGENERDDLSLLQAWREGDDDAGNRLFERYFVLVSNFFEARVRDSAEDLVQQTFLACLSPGANFRGDSTFRSYLLAAARRKLMDHFRTKQRKHAPLDFQTTTLADLGTPLSSQLARRQEHRILIEALRSIPVDQQIAIDLFYFQDLSAAEVAVVIEVPEGTVRSRLRRGLDSLRERINALSPSSRIAHSTLSQLDALQTKRS